MPTNPRQYFYRTLAGLDEIHMECLSNYGAGHPITMYIETIREACQQALQESWYIL